MNTDQNLKIRFALVCVFLCLLFSFSVSAQRISGVVTDGQNAPVQNAQITLTSQTKTISQTKTDAEGKFILNFDARQNYILLVKSDGFTDFSKSLTRNFNESLTIVLQPAVSENVTVSITKTASRLNETPASIVVLNRENLAQTAAQTIDDSLRQVAGFTLFRRGSSKTINPTTQGANLRGIGGSGAARTEVLFDGISLNDAFGGWTYWTRVPKIAVEQAEVVRGGASSIYGNSALSGAINLQTKEASDKPVLRFEMSGGLQKTFDGSFFTSFGRRGWIFDFAAESFQTDGYVPTAKAERGAIDAKANSRFNNSFLTIERKFGDDLKIFGRANLFKERRANGTNLTENRTYFRQLVFGADYARRKLGAFEFRSSLEKQIYDQTFSSVSADRNTESLTRVQRVPSQASFASVFWTNIFGNHSIVAAADWRAARGFSDENAISANLATSFLSAGGKERRNGFYVQDFWRADSKLNLNFGGRFDDWREYDARSSSVNLITNQTSVVNFSNRREHSFSPRIGAIYQVKDNLSVLATYTNSFRAPTLNELYRAFRVGSVLTQANENLRAERADTFETGANFFGFSKRLNLRGNVFYTNVSNPVVSVTLTTTPSLITRQRRNVGRTRTRGIELDAEFSPAPNLRLSASYLAVDSRVKEFSANNILIGKFLPQIPRQQLTFQAFYIPRKRFAISLQGRISGAQFEDDLNTLSLRPYFVLDAFASYKFLKRFKIFTAVENIFDNRYDIGLTPNLTVAAPRFVRVGISFN